jgi:hypothetical protein
MFDQRILTSMKIIRTINQGLSFKALDQANFLRLRTHRAANIRMVRKARSNELPDATSSLVLWNQTPRGLLEM